MSGLLSFRSSASPQPEGCALAPQPRLPRGSPSSYRARGTWGLCQLDNREAPVLFLPIILGRWPRTCQGGALGVEGAMTW